MNKHTCNFQWENVCRPTCVGCGVDEDVADLTAEAKASNLAFDIVQRKYEAVRDERDKLREALQGVTNFNDAEFKEYLVFVMGDG
jgi:prefoldin subunit 5